nr:endonuclease domain-containing protein [uncultured Sphingomonas sp.]
MRRAMTEPETRLWLALRGRRLDGVKFARQVVLGPYIVDFCARTPRLAIEVDGETYTDQSRDDRRTAWLIAQGYRVLRFTNADVMMNLDGVLQMMAVALATAPHQQRVNSAPRCSVHAGGMDDPLLLSPPGRGLSDDRQ